MKVTFKQIERILQAAKCNPAKDPVVRPILSVATPEYLRMRVQELLAAHDRNLVVMIRLLAIAAAMEAQVEAEKLKDALNEQPVPQSNP